MVEGESSVHVIRMAEAGIEQRLLGQRLVLYQRRTSRNSSATETLLSISATALPKPDSNPLSSANDRQQVFVIVAMLGPDVDTDTIVRQRRCDADTP